uniref:Ras-specific guanine nucleotide-releasing factor RalGPS1 n=1 Tax=Aceria tosichella TaxID=561515 RepID=A0A6G1SAA4_9ACAR
MKLINANKQYSMIDVDPEDLAAQITLIDLPIFKAIRRDEFLSSATSRERASARRHQSSPCPNVSAMKRQFNQVSFWAVRQILAHNSARQRAELVSHIIKTAKHLYQLNNLHSSFALVSALLSSPIYRLEKTWQNVNKRYPKDKAQFDRLRHLYSDTNNYESLRQHLATCDLPCIPYLGVYSRDIIYINELHHEDTPQRTKSTNKILESIEKFQSSEYDHLLSMKDVHDYLMSNRFIDELQRFIEDENHRRSLEIEPPNSCINGGGSNGSLAIDHRFAEQASRLYHSSSASTITSQSSDNHNHHQHNHYHHHHSNQQQLNHHNQRSSRSNMLAGLSSMVHSAVISTSTKLNNISPLASNPPTKLSATTLVPPACNAQKSWRYLIDDSFVDGINKIDENHHSFSRVSKSANSSDDNLYSADKDHTNFPPPISTSS